MSTKQVIVVRRDLGMRAGKIGAQSAHASESFITRQIQKQAKVLLERRGPRDAYLLNGDYEVSVVVSRVELEWMLDSFAKVVLKVKDLEELLQIRDCAITAGLETHLIVDSGRTEFHGEATPTAVAIGPDYEEKIDPITGHLPLY